MRNCCDITDDECSIRFIFSCRTLQPCHFFHISSIEFYVDIIDICRLFMSYTFSDKLTYCIPNYQKTACDGVDDVDDDRIV